MKTQDGMLKLRRDWHLDYKIYKRICIVFRLAMAFETCENVWGLRKTVEIGQSQGEVVFQPKVFGLR